MSICESNSSDDGSSKTIIRKINNNMYSVLSPNFSNIRNF